MSNSNINVCLLIILGTMLTNGSDCGNIENTHTYHFIFLPIPDWCAEKTFDLTV